MILSNILLRHHWHVFTSVLYFLRSGFVYIKLGGLVGCTDAVESHSIPLHHTHTCTTCRLFTTPVYMQISVLIPNCKTSTHTHTYIIKHNDGFKVGNYTKNNITKQSSSFPSLCRSSAVNNTRSTYRCEVNYITISQQLHF